MGINRFYVCHHCGNTIGMIHDAGVPIFCCGEKMEGLTPNTVEASEEKHVPVVSIRDGLIHVSVGSTAHPMTPEHSIEWIYLQTNRGGQRKTLSCDEAPEVDFALQHEEPIAVYAYCNLHGLWMTEI